MFRPRNVYTFEYFLIFIFAATIYTTRHTPPRMSSLSEIDLKFKNYSVCINCRIHIQSFLFTCIRFWIVWCERRHQGVLNQAIGNNTSKIPPISVAFGSKCITKCYVYVCYNFVFNFFFFHIKFNVLVLLTCSLIFIRIYAGRDKVQSKSTGKICTLFGGCWWKKGIN